MAFIRNSAGPSDEGKGAHHARFFQRKQRRTRRAKLVFLHVAKVHIVQAQPALFHQIVKADLARIDPRLCRRRLDVRREHQPLDNAPLGPNVKV